MDVLLVVAQQDFIHPQVRAVLSCVCSDLRTAVAETRVDFKKITFDEPVVKGARITLTEARKFKLTDEDLECLPCEEAYIRVYRQVATFYNKKDVIALRLSKYGGFHVKRESAAHAKRLDKLKQLNIDPDHVCAGAFVKNGVGGIKGLRERFDMYSKHDFPESDWELIFSGKLTIDGARRKKEMRRALAERGLKLRGDSYLCTKYINEGAGDLDDIAKKMKIMHILHTHTNYIKVLDSLPYYDNREEKLEEARRIVMNGKKFGHLFQWCRV